MPLPLSARGHPRGDPLTTSSLSETRPPDLDDASEKSENDVIVGTAKAKKKDDNGGRVMGSGGRKERGPRHVAQRGRGEGEWEREREGEGVSGTAAVDDTQSIDAIRVCMVRSLSSATSSTTSSVATGMAVSDGLREGERRGVGECVGEGQSYLSL
jgi:hypothetical protein